MMKLKTLALATSIALSAMSVAGTAQAGALATSVLDITNFTLSRGGTLLDFNTDFSGRISPTNSADISASLNGTTKSDTQNGVGQDIDLNHLNATVGVPIPGYVENSYFAYTAPPALGTSFALADQSQFGSPITNLPDTVNGGVVSNPATASTAAYVSLDDQGVGSSSANNALQAGFTFALNHGGPIDFKFDARAYLEAFTAPGSNFPTNAESQYSLLFTIRDL
ncbi:MAG: EDSAP-1 family PEP-CTERM protein, partial [Nitrosospira sp.]